MNPLILTNVKENFKRKECLQKNRKEVTLNLMNFVMKLVKINIFHFLKVKYV